MCFSNFFFWLHSYSRGLPGRIPFRLATSFSTSLATVRTILVFLSPLLCAHRLHSSSNFILSDVCSGQPTRKSQHLHLGNGSLFSSPLVTATVFMPDIIAGISTILSTFLLTLFGTCRLQSISSPVERSRNHTSSWTVEPKSLKHLVFRTSLSWSFTCPRSSPPPSI